MPEQKNLEQLQFDRAARQAEDERRIMAELIRIQARKAAKVLAAEEIMRREDARFVDRKAWEKHRRTGKLWVTPEQLQHIEERVREELVDAGLKGEKLEKEVQARVLQEVHVLYGGLEKESASIRDRMSGLMEQEESEYQKRRSHGSKASFLESELRGKYDQERSLIEKEFEESLQRARKKNSGLREELYKAREKTVDLKEKIKGAQKFTGVSASQMEKQAETRKSIRDEKLLLDELEKSIRSLSDLEQKYEQSVSDLVKKEEAVRQRQEGVSRKRDEEMSALDRESAGNEEKNRKRFEEDLGYLERVAGELVQKRADTEAAHKKNREENKERTLEQRKARENELTEALRVASEILDGKALEEGNATREWVDFQNRPENLSAMERLHAANAARAQADADIILHQGNKERAQTALDKIKPDTGGGKKGPFSLEAMQEMQAGYKKHLSEKDTDRYWSHWKADGQSAKRNPHARSLESAVYDIAEPLGLIRDKGDSSHFLYKMTTDSFHEFVPMLASLRSMEDYDRLFDGFEPNGNVLEKHFIKNVASLYPEAGESKDAIHKAFVQKFKEAVRPLAAQFIAAGQTDPEKIRVLEQEVLDATKKEEAARLQANISHEVAEKIKQDMASSSQQGEAFRVRSTRARDEREEAQRKRDEVQSELGRVTAAGDKDTSEIQEEDARVLRALDEEIGAVHKRLAEKKSAGISEDVSETRRLAEKRKNILDAHDLQQASLQSEIDSLKSQTGMEDQKRTERLQGGVDLARRKGEQEIRIRDLELLAEAQKEEMARNGRAVYDFFLANNDRVPVQELIATRDREGLEKHLMNHLGNVSGSQDLGNTNFLSAYVGGQGSFSPAGFVNKAARSVISGEDLDADMSHALADTRGMTREQHNRWRSLSRKSVLTPDETAFMAEMKNLEDKKGLTDSQKKMLLELEKIRDMAIAESGKGLFYKDAWDLSDQLKAHEEGTARLEESLKEDLDEESRLRDEFSRKEEEISLRAQEDADKTFAEDRQNERQYKEKIERLSRQIEQDKQRLRALGKKSGEVSFSFLDDTGDRTGWESLRRMTPWLDAEGEWKDMGSRETWHKNFSALKKEALSAGDPVLNERLRTARQALSSAEKYRHLSGEEKEAALDRVVARYFEGVRQEQRVRDEFLRTNPSAGLEGVRRGADQAKAKMENLDASTDASWHDFRGMHPEFRKEEEGDLDSLSTEEDLVGVLGQEIRDQKAYEKESDRRLGDTKKKLENYGKSAMDFHDDEFHKDYKALVGLLKEERQEYMKDTVLPRIHNLAVRRGWGRSGEAIDRMKAKAAAENQKEIDKIMAKIWLQERGSYRENKIKAAELDLLAHMAQSDSLHQKSRESERLANRKADVLENRRKYAWAETEPEIMALRKEIANLDTEEGSKTAGIQADRRYVDRFADLAGRRTESDRARVRHAYDVANQEFGAADRRSGHYNDLIRDSWDQQRAYEGAIGNEMEYAADRYRDSDERHRYGLGHKFRNMERTNDGRSGISQARHDAFRSNMGKGLGLFSRYYGGEF